MRLVCGPRVYWAEEIEEDRAGLFFRLYRRDIGASDSDSLTPIDCRESCGGIRLPESSRVLEVSRVDRRRGGAELEGAADAILKVGDKSDRL